MKVKFIKFINIAMLAGLFLSACSNDDVDSTSRITVPELPNETSVSEDYWIYQNLVVPYNMEVKYRWDDSEADLTKNLIPPRLDYVVPLLNIIKKHGLNLIKSCRKKVEKKCILWKSTFLVFSI